jgi:hypothetical protein
MSITTSVPETVSKSVSSRNEPTTPLLPTFVSQAKFLLKLPPSPKHCVQRRFTPAADAIVAVIARSKPHNRVTLFIVGLRDLFPERESGRTQPRRRIDEAHHPQ